MVHCCDASIKLPHKLTPSRGALTCIIMCKSLYQIAYRLHRRAVRHRLTTDIHDASVRLNEHIAIAAAAHPACYSQAGAAAQDCVVNQSHGALVLCLELSCHCQQGRLLAQICHQAQVVSIP